MYDHIIVGAGSAGCVLANRLSADPDRKVLVLEAGGGTPPLESDMPAGWLSLLNTEVDWCYYTVPQAGARNRKLFWPRGKVVGGSGSLNAMIYIRGLPSDYDRWQALGCPGWDWKNVLPVFISSEANERLANSPLHGSDGELVITDPVHVDAAERAYLDAAAAAGFPHNTDFNGPVQDGVGLFQLTVKDGRRHGTARAFLFPALERPNLTLATGVLTTRLLIENGRAVGVEYLRMGQVEKAYASGDIVLCAGAINSPQLLLLSGIGPADELAQAGVKVVHDLPGVGKNLQDHVNVVITYHTKEKSGIGGMTDAEFAAGIEAWKATRTGPMSSTWAAVGGFIKSDPTVAEPDLQIYGVASGHRDHARYLGERSGFGLYTTLQRPLSHGEIRLRSADPLQHPAIDPRYFSDPDGQDLAIMIKGVRLNRQIAAAEPLKSLLQAEVTPSAGCHGDQEIGDYIRSHCATLYHPTCTCSMGTGPLAVVGPDLTVHGIAGLRIADASVMPTIVSGNTNAPTIMIAERAARFVAG